MNHQLGRQGEDFAALILEQAGLTIVRRNYRCPKGEMDIIAWDKNTLIFVEVRTRSSAERGWGEESITAAKRRRLNQTAAFYILEAGYKDWPSMRLDLIAIRWNGKNTEPISRWIQGI